jgi:hypothetical protein
MNNASVKVCLDNCQTELDSIHHTIRRLVTSPICNYLLQYAVIRACSTIEQAYKNLIADFYDVGNTKLSNFITHHVRETSCNPSYENIYKQVNEFEPSKAASFESAFNAIPDHAHLKGSLKSLKNLRNNVAHGTSVSSPIAQVEAYYADSRKIIECLDRILI